MVKMYETTKETILFVEISSLPVPRASRILIVSDEYMYVFVCYLLHLLLANSASTTIEDTQPLMPNSCFQTKNYGIACNAN